MAMPSAAALSEHIYVQWKANAAKLHLPSFSTSLDAAYTHTHCLYRQMGIQYVK